MGSLQNATHSWHVKEKFQRPWAKPALDARSVSDTSTSRAQGATYFQDKIETRWKLISARTRRTAHPAEEPSWAALRNNTS